MAPIAAVTAMASAVQKPTLSAGFTIGAPPAQAPSAPSAARKTNAAAGTGLAMAPCGARNAVSVGDSSPSENASADANAAWDRFGPGALVQASSSRAWASSDLLGELRFQAPLFVDTGKLFLLLDRVLAERAPLARQVSGLGVGLREDGHIFARRHRHRARRPPGDRRGQDFGPPTRGRCDPHYKAGGRNDPVVGAEDPARSQAVRWT